jgi:hypothetical protein
MSLAPCGTTLMMSASDLITFAQAHMSRGVGGNGARILSEASASAMQQISVDNKGKGYTYIDQGLGWMVADDGLLTHAGGGPGIASVLYAYPERRFAAAILTNAEYALAFTNEFVDPWLREAGSTKPMGVVDIRLPEKAVPIDPNRYVGVYEEYMSRYRVSRMDNGIAISAQAKVAYTDGISLSPTPSQRLIPLGGDVFALEGKGDYRVPDASRIFTFRNPDAGGRSQHLGNFCRLYRRVG